VLTCRFLSTRTAGHLATEALCIEPPLPLPATLQTQLSPETRTRGREEGGGGEGGGGGARRCGRARIPYVRHLRLLPRLPSESPAVVPYLTRPLCARANLATPCPMRASVGQDVPTHMARHPSQRSMREWTLF
jgi:hypothetical protein